MQISGKRRIKQWEEKEIDEVFNQQTRKSFSRCFSIPYLPYEFVGRNCLIFPYISDKWPSTVHLSQCRWFKPETVNSFHELSFANCRENKMKLEYMKEKESPTLCKPNNVWGNGSDI